jgi:hypothetical protein
MGSPCLWDKGPPLCNDLTSKVCESVHSLPPSRFKLVTSYEETHVLNHYSHYCPLKGYIEIHPEDPCVDPPSKPKYLCPMLQGHIAS